MVLVTSSEVLTPGMESTARVAVVPAESLTATEAMTATFMGKVVEGRVTKAVAVSFSYWILL